MALLLLAGCSSSPSVAPTASPSTNASVAPSATASPVKPASLPANWATAKSNDGKVTLGLPKEWLVSNPEDPNFKKAMADLGKDNPNLPSMVNQKYYFMALSTKPKDNFSDNVNIIKSQAKMDIPMTEDSAKQLAAQMKTMMPGAAAPEVKLVQLPVGSAFRYQTNMKFNTGKNSTFETYLVGYLLFKDHQQYVVTFSTIPKRKDKFPELADLAMSTFEIKQ